MTGMPGARRTFVCVEVPPACQEHVDRLVAGFRSRVSGARWVSRDHFHLTIRFLGDLTESDIHVVTEAARVTAAARASFEVNLDDFGVFPDERRPRVLFLAVGHGGDELTSLRMDLDRHLIGAGMATDNVKFVPHLTLARLAPSNNPALQASIHQVLNQPPTPPVRFVAEGLTVMNSRLTRSGSEYSAASRHRFEDLPTATVALA
jgi:2'-5' RNA ligase